MAYRLILSVVVSGLSLLVVTDAQIPIGPLEEISPLELGRVLTGRNPTQPAPPLNRVPFVRQGMMLRQAPMQARFNAGIPPMFPNIFNRNLLPRGRIPGNQVGMIAPGMRIVPLGNTVRSFRQQQLQQEAMRRSQIAQRFRPVVNATPPRFGVATIQQASAIQQSRAQPGLQQAVQVDLGSFPNFGTTNGNAIGNQLINQLVSFQQVSADGLGQNSVVVPQQSAPQVMPTLLPASQQFGNLLNQPAGQQPRGQIFAVQGASPTQNLQPVTVSSGVIAPFSNNLPSQQPALTSAQGLSTAARNAVQLPSTSSGTNQPQWSFQTSNALTVPGIQEATQISQTSSQTSSQSNQVSSDQTNAGFTSQPGQSFSNQDFLGPSPTVPSKPVNENSPVQFDEQVTIFHPANQELCYRGRNLSPDLLTWIVNILTLRIQSPDGNDLCRNRDSYTIPELVEMEKEFLAMGIDPHNKAAFRTQPNVVDIGNNAKATGTAVASNAQLPIPPSDALLAMSVPTQRSQNK